MHLQLRLLACCVIAAALFLVGSAHPTWAQSKDAPAESGTVNLDRSRVYVFVAKKGKLGHDHGMVGRLKSGRLKLGATEKAGELVIDMTSFLADTKEARRHVGLEGEHDAATRASVTQAMLGATVLDSANHPTATWLINSAKQVKSTKPGVPQSYLLEGEFTLHGETKPLNVTVVAEKFEGEQRVRGDFTILQTDYGIKPFTKAFGTVGVTNDLKIWGDLLVKP